MNNDSIVGCLLGTAVGDALFFFTASVDWLLRIDFNLPCTAENRTIAFSFYRRSMMPSSDTKMARIETRVSAEKKELIERAAAYQGRSVSEFMIANAEQAARAVIEEHEQLKLDRAQSRALVDVLLSRSTPNKRLRDAAISHRKHVKSQ